MMDTLCSVGSFGKGDVANQEGLQGRVFTNLLTYDVGADTDAPKTIKEAVQVASLSKYGRVLWGALQRSGATADQWLVDFAALKISGAERRVPEAHEIDQRCAVALFAARTNVEIGVHTTLPQGLVVSHMAHLDGLDAFGNPHASYPSDPILSLGAAKVLGGRGVYLQALKHLNLLVRSSQVQPGFRGELLTQLLTLRAYDELVFADGVYQARPVTVRDFLKKLFGLEDFAKFEKLGLLTAANSKVLDGYVHLTHYTPLYDYEPSRADLLWFLRRGAGVVCQHNQQDFDLVVPVLLQESVDEGAPAKTKTAVPAKADPIEYQRRFRASVSERAGAEVGERVAAAAGHLDRMGPSEAVFVVPAPPLASSATVERDGGEEEDPHGKRKMPASSPSLQPSSPATPTPTTPTRGNGTTVLQAEHVSYISIQCKNLMSSVWRSNPKLSPGKPLETSGQTSRPHMFVVAVFTENQASDVYTTSEPPADASGLSVVWLNGHHAVREQLGGDEIAEQLAELPRRFGDPTQLGQGEAMWKVLQHPGTYGTEVDLEMLTNVQAALDTGSASPAAGAQRRTTRRRPRTIRPATRRSQRISSCVGKPNQ